VNCKEVVIPSSELSVSPSELSTSSNSASMIVITSPSLSSAMMPSEVSLTLVLFASSVDFSMESPVCTTMQSMLDGRCALPLAIASRIGK